MGSDVSSGPWCRRLTPGHERRGLFVLSGSNTSPRLVESLRVQANGSISFQCCHNGMDNTSRILESMHVNVSDSLSLFQDAEAHCDCEVLNLI